MNDVATQELLPTQPVSAKGNLGGTFGSRTMVGQQEATVAPMVGAEIVNPEEQKRREGLERLLKIGKLLDASGIQLKTDESGKVLTGMVLPANLLADELRNVEEERKETGGKNKILQNKLDKMQREYDALMLRLTNNSPIISPETATAEQVSEPILEAATPIEQAPITETKLSGILRPRARTPREVMAGGAIPAPETTTAIGKAAEEAPEEILNTTDTTQKEVETVDENLEKNIPVAETADDIITSNIISVEEAPNVETAPPIIENVVPVVPDIIQEEPVVTEVIPTPEIAVPENTQEIHASEDPLETEFPFEKAFKKPVDMPEIKEEPVVIDAPVAPDTPEPVAVATPQETTPDLEQKGQAAVQSLQQTLVKIRGDDGDAWKKYIIPEYVSVNPEAAQEKISWREFFVDTDRQTLEDFGTLDEKTFLSKYIKSDDLSFSEKILTATCHDIFNEETKKSFFRGPEGISVDAKKVDHRLEIRNLLGLLSKLDERAVSSMSKLDASKVNDVYSSPDLTVGNYIAHVKSNITTADSN